MRPWKGLHEIFSSHHFGCVCPLRQILEENGSKKLVTEGVLSYCDIPGTVVPSTEQVTDLVPTDSSF